MSMGVAAWTSSELSDRPSIHRDMRCSRPMPALLFLQAVIGIMHSQPQELTALLSGRMRDACLQRNAAIASSAAENQPVT